jgi:hypothetical protein
MTGHDADYEWLQSSRTYENGQTTNTDEATDIQCQKLKASLAREERAKFAVAERKNRIKKFMADNNASELESSVGTFTWKTNVKGVATFKHPFKSERA